MNKENKILIFDLWQTLADSKSRPSDLFYILSPLENKIPKQEFLEKLFKSDIYLKDIPIEESMRNFLSKLKMSNGDILNQLIIVWKSMLNNSFLIDGAKELISNLKLSGYKLCLLTDVDKYGFENFLFNDFIELFDHKILSYKNGLIKPNQKCWENIKNHYGVNYCDMTMIGDSIKKDIDPANALGIKTILIDITKDKDKIYEDVYKEFLNN